MHEDKCFHQIKISPELQADFDRVAKLRRLAKIRHEGITIPRSERTHGYDEEDIPDTR